MSDLEELFKSIIKIEVEKHIQRVESEKVFNTKEAAEYLRVSKDWLYKNLDKIPHADLGGYKFLKTDLDHYIKSKTKKISAVDISNFKGKGCEFKV